MRSEATLKNSIWGIIQQVIVCVMSLFSRRVMLETIGVEGVGLNAFLNSVITMLSLAELGIGSALVYHMYAPIAVNDEEHIAQLMRTYKNVYRIIASVIMLIGLSLLPFMDKIVKDVSYSKSYVSLIFVLFLIQTTSSYLFTYKRSMLSADQKQYVITIFDLGYKIITITVGIVILKLTGELAWYLVMLIFCTVAENVLISRKVDRLYPFINRYREYPEKSEMMKIAADVKNIFIGKVSGVVTNSTDSVLINMFVGTVQNGLYSNYNIILGTLLAALRQFSDAMRGSIGNLVAVESKEHIDLVFQRLMFIMFFIASFCACCLTGLINPFINIIFGRGLLLDRIIVYVCILNLYMSTITIPALNMVTASGLFSFDKYISLAGTVINLIISVILGKSIGMAGILIGTSSTYIIQFILKVILLYNNYLHISCVKIFAKNIVFALITVAECALVNYTSGLVSLGNEFISFIIIGVISCAIPIFINTALFFRTFEFKYSFDLLNGIRKKLLNSRCKK